MNAIRESLRNDYSRLIAIVTLIFVSVLAYWLVTLQIVPGNSSSAVGALILASVISVIFWALVLILVFGLVLRNAFFAFLGILRHRLWAKILFPSYLVIHLLIYGLVLERILVSIFGQPGYNVGQLVFIQLGSSFYPHTLFNALIQMTLSPSIVMFMPPFYGIELTLFSFCSAIIIAVLVIVHLERLSRYAGLIRRAGGSVMYPLIAVIGGASCCISLPGIFLDFTPLASSILLVPMWVDVLNVLYYLLPVSVIVLLAIGLRQFEFLTVSGDTK